MSRRQNDLEQRALQLIFKSEEGILQSEMWKKLGVSSREGSRLALKFEEKGVINRVKVLHGGRWTYRIYSKRQPVTIESLMGCPCLMCAEIEKCAPRGSSSPLKCSDLSRWIENVGETEAEVSG